MRAVQYIRVSNADRNRSGYSIEEQIEATRRWAEAEGATLVSEPVIDKGWSGYFVERPGLDRVRGMALNREIDAVVVAYRDRLARGHDAALLAMEFRESGVRVVALNAMTEDTPEGELTEGILDQISGYEGKKIRQRTMTARNNKAKSGLLPTPGPRPPYGYHVNDSNDQLVVYEPEMEVVRRILMRAASGYSINSIATSLTEEGIPTPTGKSARWSRQFIRKAILSDLYRPHTVEEMRPYISDELYARLDDTRTYGIYWWGKNSVRSTRGKSRIKTQNPPSAWVAIPVEHSGLPRETVDRARRNIEGNVPTPRVRTWELPYKTTRCGICKEPMARRPWRATKGNKTYEAFYYLCRNRDRFHDDAICTHKDYYRAQEIEPRVWESVVKPLILEKGRIEAALDEIIKRESAINTPAGFKKRERILVKQLREVEAKRVRFLDLATEVDEESGEPLISRDELKSTLATLANRRRAIEEELESARAGAKRFERLIQDTRALRERYKTLTEIGVENLTPEERVRIYTLLHESLGLTIYIHPGMRIEWKAYLHNGETKEQPCPRVTEDSNNGKTSTRRHSPYVELNGSGDTLLVRAWEGSAHKNAEFSIPI